MLFTTIRYAIAYSFYAMSAFAASFLASLLGRFEQYHPAWNSLRSLALYSMVIISVAILAAILRTHSARTQPTYRYKLAT